MPANLTELIAELNTTELAWQASARCAEAFYGDLFFPAATLYDEEERGALAWQAEAAKRVCASCPARVACREYGESIKADWGIWGGVDFSKPAACRRNHPTEGNLRLDANGSRRCKACDREQKRRERGAA